MKYDDSHAQRHSVSRISALVVEDDIELRELFVELLRAHNIDIVGTGSNGKEAEELYQIHHPDIVFMDLMMPVYDGYYGIRKIKEQDKDAKIIVVSGPFADSSMLARYKIMDVVEKPIDMKKIGYAINKWMTDKIKAKMR